MTRSLRRGALIVFEGADRVGKSSRAAALVDSLRSKGKSVQLLKFPDRETEIGSLISRYLQNDKALDDRAVHLLFSANRWEWFNRMKEAMTSGVTLVIDRYAYSGVAYTAAKSGMELEWCKLSDTGLMKADSVLYITLPDDVVSQRPGFGDERYEKQEFQAKVKKNYELLRDETWNLIPGDVPIEELDQKILQSALKTINECESNGRPIYYLW